MNFTRTLAVKNAYCDSNEQSWSIALKRPASIVPILFLLGWLSAASLSHAQPTNLPASLRDAVATLKDKAAANPRGSIRVIARLSEAAVSRSRQGMPLARSATGADTPATLTTTPEFIRSAQNQLLRRMIDAGAMSTKRIEGVPMVVLEVNGAQLDLLIGSGEVAAVFEDEVADLTLNDSGPLIGADVAHNLDARGAGTTIAILDTGVSATHEFLSGRVLNGACFSTSSLLKGSDTVCPDGSESSTEVTAGNPCVFDGCDHGTHVAGIAAGRSSASFRANGVAPDARILPVQVFSRRDGKMGSFTSDQVAGMQYVRQRASIDNIVAVNFSLGNSSEYKSGCDLYTDMYGRPGLFRLPFAEMVHVLHEMGIATTISSGNDDHDHGVSSPGCTSEAITVGASDKNDVIADFSNHGVLVDLLAPGVGIKSSVNSGGNVFGVKSGTSMAAPHVAGAIAVIRSRVAMSVDQMVALLQSTGDPVSGARNSPARVRINIGRAMQQVAPSRPPTVGIDRSRLIRASTGRCLDAHGPTAGQNGGRVQVWSCNGQPQQLWTALPNGVLRNEAGGLCLEVNGTEIQHNGALARLWACNTSPQQHWTVVPSNKTIKISSGLCLDANSREQFTDGGRVDIHGCNGGLQQQWTFVAPDILARESSIRTGAGLCLDVHAPEVAINGGHVQVWACNNQSQQRWTYNQTTRAVQLASGRCLDADLKQMTTKGGRVQIWACNGQAQQQWEPQPNGALRNGGGLCIDAHAPTQTINGGAVQLWACNGQQQQRFALSVF